MECMLCGESINKEDWTIPFGRGNEIGHTPREFVHQECHRQDSGEGWMIVVEELLKRIQLLESHVKILEGWIQE